MQFKVPQDVLRADKIVGFLTLRQLIICILGGSIAYSLYVVLIKQYGVEIWFLPVLLVSLTTAAFAFVRFNDLVFEKFFLLCIEYKFLPRIRTWQKMKGDIHLSVLAAPLQKRHEAGMPVNILTTEERRKKLREVTHLVDTHGKEMIGKKGHAP